MDGRSLLRDLWNAALAAVDPEKLVAEFLRSEPFLPPGGRIGVFAAGKAAPGMAMGVPRGLYRDALIVAPHGANVPRSLRRFARYAAHPDPDRASVSAAKEALRFFRAFGEGDLVLALLSGGASSLLCLPRRGVTLAEKRERVRRAMEKGWPIERLNRLRTSLSLVKGGRLAEATRARVVTLVLSDVPGADFRIVGSGPTVSRRRGHDQAILLAGNRTGLEAAARRARRRGFRARLEPAPFSGEAAETGRVLARRLLASGAGVLLAGGETTVRGNLRGGTGGRNQELALGAAMALAGYSGCAILSAGSDGIDGNSVNAGAFADGGTAGRAARLDISPESFLRRHDSAEFFDLLGDTFRPGASGTNVADWVFAIRTAARK